MKARVTSGLILITPSRTAAAFVWRPDLSVALAGRMLPGYYEEGKTEYLNDLRKSDCQNKRAGFIFMRREAEIYEAQ